MSSFKSSDSPSVRLLQQFDMKAALFILAITVSSGTLNKSWNNFIKSIFIFHVALALTCRQCGSLITGQGTISMCLSIDDNGKSVNCDNGVCVKGHGVAGEHI